jgi:hypothetical protein
MKIHTDGELHTGIFKFAPQNQTRGECCDSKNHGWEGECTPSKPVEGKGKPFHCEDCMSSEGKGGEYERFKDELRQKVEEMKDYGEVGDYTEGFNHAIDSVLELIKEL